MEYSDAVAAFNEAVRLSPRFVEAHLQLARTYLALGRVDESLASAQEALKLQPANPEGHLIASRAYLTKGDTANADASIKLLIASNPKSAAVQAQLGYLEHASQERRPGAGGLRASPAGSPSQPDALQALNTMDIRAGNTAAARDRIERRVKADSKNASLRIIAAQTYIPAGELASAERALREALDLDSRRSWLRPPRTDLRVAKKIERGPHRVRAGRPPPAEGRRPANDGRIIYELQNKRGRGEALV